MSSNEVCAGLLLTLGLLKPLAVAAFVGRLKVAVPTDHRGKGYFVFRGSSESTLVIALAATSILLGSRPRSVDHLAGLGSFHGVRVAAAADIVGLTSAAAVLASFSRSVSPD